MVRCSSVLLWLSCAALSWSLAAPAPAWAQSSPPEPGKPLPAEGRTAIANRWRAVRLVHQLRGHETRVDALLFSTDSRVLISGGTLNDPTIRHWSLQSGRQLNSTRAQATTVQALAIGMDGFLLASSGGDTGIHIWQRGRYERALMNHFSAILALAISPDNRVLVSGGFDGIRVWDLAAQRPIYTLARFETPTYELAIAADGRTLASGGPNGRVQLWDLRTGDRLAELQAPRLGDVTALAFAPDGKTLLAGGDDRLIYLWNLPTGEPLREPIAGHTGKIRAIAVHPSGEFFASASDDGARLWTLPSGRPLNRLSARQDWVDALAFSPDGRWLATGGFDRQIAVWEAY